MNNIFWIILLYLLEKVCLEYETIDLVFANNYYYIPLNFPDPKNKEYYLFSTNLPMSFFPSYYCSKCINLIINEKNFQNKNKSISIPYFFYNFTGRLFSGSYSTDKYISKLDFLSFDNLTYASNFLGNGYFSLSFLNYNYNTSKKIFALKFSGLNAELHLGDYEHKREMDDLKTFNITIEHKYENHTEPIIRKNLNSIFDNYLLIEEDDNKTRGENITYEIDKSVWFMSFPKLNIIKGKELKTNETNYKLTLDMSANRFYIPKNFFIKYVDHIFPEKAACQVTREGFFTCKCDEKYKTEFGSFKFISENDDIFLGKCHRLYDFSKLNFW